jgi:hypothetical protein
VKNGAEQAGLGALEEIRDGASTPTLSEFTATSTSTSSRSTSESITTALAVFAAKAMSTCSVGTAFLSVKTPVTGAYGSESKLRIRTTAQVIVPIPVSFSARKSGTLNRYDVAPFSGSGRLAPRAPDQRTTDSERSGLLSRCQLSPASLIASPRIRFSNSTSNVTGGLWTTTGGTGVELGYVISVSKPMSTSVAFATSHVQLPAVERSAAVAV